MEIGRNLHRPPKLSWCRMLQLLLLLSIAVSVTAQAGSCNAVLPKEVDVRFSTELCTQPWSAKGLTVRFADNATTLSMVVSVTKESRWYGVGFNKDNRMVGSAAMVVWVDATTSVVQIKQYSLDGRTSTAVKISSRLNFTGPGAPRGFVTADSIFMAFQIDKGSSDSVSFDHQVYAYGAQGQLPEGSNFRLNFHESMNAVRFDYTSGTATVSYSDPASLRKKHGIINIFGWGILLPVGAIIARYCRQWDPAWFYLHVGLQIIGYVLINVALVMGIQLTNKIPDVDYNTHRGLGIFVFVLAAIQVSALLIRPKKDAKIRRYWNFCHHWAGRIALLIAAINVFSGIHVSNGGGKWQASYGLVLVIELVVVAVLEILLRVNRAAEKEPALQLGGGHLQPNYPNSAPPSYDNYRNQI